MSLTPRIDRLNKNYVRNGGFDIWQSGSSFTSPANGALLADRFKFFKTAGTNDVDVARSTDIPDNKSKYSMLLNVTAAQASLAASDLIIFEYRMEGNDLADLIDDKITLGFQVKSKVAGTYCVSFHSSDGLKTYVAEYEVNVANTWEQKYITVDLSTAGTTWATDISLGMKVTWGLAVGTDFQTTAGSWNNGNFFGTANQTNLYDTLNNNMNICQIKIIKGERQEEFNRAGYSYEDELRLCQRYLYSSYNVNVAPGTGSATGTMILLYEGTTGVRRMNFSLPVEMRVNPSVTFYNPVSGASGSWRDVSGGGADISMVLDRVSAKNLGIGTNVSVTGGNNLGGHLLVNAEL